MPTLEKYSRDSTISDRWACDRKAIIKSGDIDPYAAEKNSRLHR